MLAVLSEDRRTYQCTLILSEDQTVEAARELLRFIPMEIRQGVLSLLLEEVRIDVADRVRAGLSAQRHT